MKLKNEKAWVPWILFITLGLILTVFLIIVSPYIFRTGLNIDFVRIIDLLLGIFVVCGLGLMLVEKSRYVGLLIVAISIPSILYFIFIDKRMLLDILALGLAIGFGITAFFVYRIRFDLLAKTLKYLTDIFLIIFIAYALYVGFTKDLAYLPYFGIILVPIIALWFFFTKNLFAVTSSDVFVMGPTGSGKSVFIAALGLEIGKAGGYSRSTIFSRNPDAKDRLTITAMSTKLKNGRTIDSNQVNEMAYYEFPTRKWGLIPLKVTALDYAGAHVMGQNIDKISKQNYEGEIQYFSQILHRSVNELKKEFWDIQFLVDFKQNYEQEFYNNFDLIVPAFAYARLLKAGKIIFLLDGAKVHTNIDEDPEWSNYVNGISRLVEELGDDKDYAFAVTKADLIPTEFGGREVRDEVRGSDPDSENSDTLERKYFNDFFRDHPVFMNILHKILSDRYIKLKYVEGFLISVDGSVHEGEGISGYHPWRLNQIINYIFKF